MSVNRIQADRWQQPTPQPAMVADSPGFMACQGCFAARASTQQWAAYQQICRLAYEQAVTASAPPWYERLFVHWN
jgi:hypothetical protein